MDRSGSKVEEQIRAALWRAIKDSTTSINKGAQENLVEFLADDLVEAQKSKESALLFESQQLEALLEDVWLSAEGVEEDEDRKFFECLSHELKLVQARFEEDNDSELEGVCQLCEREIPLTRHHVFPRAVHKDLKRKGYTIQQLSATVSICRSCHTAIHKFIPEKELALHYNTIEALEEHEKVKNFIEWNSKQKVRTKRR
ncbi:hypothetical protein NDN08_001496 [Rhodosorus marinus]|uniref:HNH domain-containing protein n=1 Tax=Rhodosorus marinus TaxID=101924 RepID=A0AAV8UQZ2_9RHOD|nr:hypothetical protein NDN08_001496 [Rhodosorus marinus]